MRIVRLLAAGIAATLVFAACAKGSNSSNAESTGAAETTTAAATMAASAAPMAAAGAAGEKVYQTNCSSCHQADGKGLAGSFPPLAGNPVVTGDPKAVIHAVKFGVTGKLMVQGHAFNGMMPPWGSQLSDDQIASVVTYVRSSWGNTAPAVSAAQVGAVTK